ncbi:MAG: hypothetical protein AVDCRST_MAG37-1579 [uncultured Rubrobacteraceae bacterium]|uniref:Uncharacterized protein n=1 Tax=uncultured Rubrobacteraceae bacterium TaxID=349277 RepID=A0A6J4QFE4_9ACTN|nr:MAG: hypothetical protein AVDCRST_MAG37-1579 [uncultured Rubrobacteraceae bacterium]
MLEPRLGIFVDYESPLARGVAERIWSGLSAAALDSGYTRATAFWESLRTTRSLERLEGSRAYVFVVGQDHPDAIDAIAPVGSIEVSHLYGVVVAVPDRPSPLSGSLLYQGVERLKDGGIKAGLVEPALLHALPKECESYARRLLERLTPLLEA